MCFLELFRVIEGGCWAVEMTCNCLGDFCWEVQKWENEVVIERINFFIIN